MGVSVVDVLMVYIVTATMALVRAMSRCRLFRMGADMIVQVPDFRNELIDGIANLLAGHNCSDFDNRCTCGTQLWKGSARGDGGSTTLLRHRAEVLVDTYRLAELMGQRA